jgi:hypothetical protein
MSFETTKEGQKMRSGIIGVLAAAVVVSSALLPNEARAQGADPSLGAAGSVPPPKACTALWVTTPTDKAGTAGRASRRAPVFSATSILDLELIVLVPAEYAGTNMELKLFTPKGHLYQTLEIDSAPSKTSGDPSRRRYELLTARLPVAGTTIVNSSLYGVWTAEAYFAGASSPCTQARAFAILP